MEIMPSQKLEKPNCMLTGAVEQKCVGLASNYIFTMGQRRPPYGSFAQDPTFQVLVGPEQRYMDLFRYVFNRALTTRHTW